MRDETFYKGDIGRVIRQTTGFDWTGATTKQVILLRPDATTIAKTAANVVVDDAPSGQIHILTASGDLNQTGEYLMQAKMVNATQTLFGPLISFMVEDVLVEVAP